MKKIIVILAALFTFSSVQAQSEREMEETKRVILGNKKGSSPTNGSKDVILGGDRRVYDDNGNRYPNNYPYGSREAQIEQINRDYDAKIYSIRNNRYLSAEEKQRMIRDLEAERARRIREVSNQYGSESRRYDDRNYKGKSKDYKKDNGKHLGWEKGKGNQKKNKH